MSDSPGATILTFSTRNTSKDMGDRLLAIESTLRVGAEQLRQLSADLDYQLQTGTFTSLDDPFATVADMGEHIDHAHTGVAHAVEQAGAAIAAWQSAHTPKLGK